MDPSQGIVHSGIVKAGTLSVGDIVVTTSHVAKIKSIFYDGKRVEKAIPGMPIDITGFESFMNPGDFAFGIKSLTEAKRIVDVVFKMQLEEQRNRHEVESIKKKKNLITNKKYCGELKQLIMKLMKMNF